MPSARMRATSARRAGRLPCAMLSERDEREQQAIADQVEGILP